MKKSTAFVLAFLSFIFQNTVVSAQANPRGTTALADKQVTIEYGRPSANGRDVIDLITPGTYWRMGADATTTLRTRTDLSFGDQRVPSGTYTLVAHFSQNREWQLVICKDVGSGYRPQGVVATVPLTLEKEDSYVEQMTIDLTERAGRYAFVLSWGTYRLSTPFSTS